jgi:hypothetical protein
LASVDLRHDVSPEYWPYDREEYPITCLLDTLPLFEHQPLGDTTLILHRFGGTYGEVRFLLKACDQAIEGSVKINLVNESGLPMQSVEVSDIHIDHQAEADDIDEIDSISTTLHEDVQETGEMPDETRLVVVGDGRTLRLVVRLSRTLKSKMIA